MSLITKNLKVLGLLAALGGFALVTLAPAPVDAQQQRRRYTERDVRGPVNYSYQQGRTRVFVTRRSWLDAGTEVLPGERKFTDYAFPPGYVYGRQIDRLNQGRQPLSENFDLGLGTVGYPPTFPLY